MEKDLEADKNHPKTSSRKILGIIVASLLVVIILFLFGYKFGYSAGSLSAPPAGIKNSSEGQPTSVDFSLFWQAWNKVLGLYSGKSDPQEMIYGAISGMVAALGDPYTAFLKPSDNEKFSQGLSGEFEGIGAELELRNGQIVVVAPISGSPAEKAGLKPKDIILEIDGASTAEMSLDEAVERIRGQAGTEVKLKIIRARVEEPLEFNITRANIKVDGVTYKIENISGKKIVTLKVSQFGDDTMTLAEKYAKQAVSDDAQGIILDLRNNPGGYLESSIDFANLFLEPGKVIVSEIDKTGTRKEYKADKTPVLKNQPLVVLVNGGSASAAEIVTGAFKDYGRATIIGEKTFGKGSVQALESLSGGAALKVTIAKWLTPLGEEINGKGITPDIEIKMTDSDKTAGTDPQMEKAKGEVVTKSK